MMARSGVLLLIIFLSAVCTVVRSTPPGTDLTASSKVLIESSCKKTRYQNFCVQSLTRFADPKRELSSRDIAYIALTVSLVKARYTHAYILDVVRKIKNTGLSKMDNQAVLGCLIQTSDGVSHLSESVRELRRMTRSESQDDFDWCSSNIITWISAALTDAGTCLDEFPSHAMNGKTRAIVKAKVLNVAQASSNALVLFHRFAANYRASSRWIKKSP